MAVQYSIAQTKPHTSRSSPQYSIVQNGYRYYLHLNKVIKYRCSEEPYRNGRSAVSYRDASTLRNAQSYLLAVRLPLVAHILPVQQDGAGGALEAPDVVLLVKGD